MPEIVAALTIDSPVETLWHDKGYALVIVEDEAIVRNLKPDFVALAKFPIVAIVAAGAASAAAVGLAATFAPSAASCGGGASGARSARSTRSAARASRRGRGRARGHGGGAIEEGRVVVRRRRHHAQGHHRIRGGCREGACRALTSRPLLPASRAV